MDPRTSEETAMDVLAALGRASHSPVSLHLLLADRCNHACEHCYQVQGLKGELTREQVENVLRDFRAGGGFVVTFSGGEATLSDDLLPLLAYAHELGLATVLYTNGYTMTEGLAQAIADAHVWRVEISLYSQRSAEHDAVTRVPGSWQKTTQGVRWLRSKNVNVTLKFTPTTQSRATAGELAVLAKELDAHLVAVEAITAGEAGRLEPTAARRAPEHAISTDFAAQTNGEGNPLEGRPCGAGRQLNIRSDGMVQPCAMLNVSMGHVGATRATLAEVAASDVARFFREVTWADFPACRVCDLRAHCHRCYASAAAEAGDMLAPYRGACELALARYRKASSGSAAVPVEAKMDPLPELGPYRLDSAGQLSSAKAQHTAYDRTLLDRYPWLRQSRELLRSSACGSSAEDQARGLIQLGRGKKRPAEGSVDS
jgi:radical SAM protein with 4Fe4S-binding SPASM domain